MAGWFGGEIDHGRCQESARRYAPDSLFTSLMAKIRRCALLLGFPIHCLGRQSPEHLVWHLLGDGWYSGGRKRLGRLSFHR